MCLSWYQATEAVNGLIKRLPQSANQDYSGTIEIIAVDSSSPDDTVKLLQQYGATVISIDQAVFSHGYARNLGVQHTQFP